SPRAFCTNQFVHYCELSNQAMAVAEADRSGKVLREKRASRSRSGCSVELLVARNETQHHVDDVAAQRRRTVFRGQVTAENLGEGHPIGNVEETESADLPVKLKRVEAFAEDAFGDTAR